MNEEKQILESVKLIVKYCKDTPCGKCIIGKSSDVCPICFPSEDWDDVRGVETDDRDRK